MFRSVCPLLGNAFGGLIVLRAQAEVFSVRRADTPLLLAQGGVTPSAEIPT